jgi:hypothetical protein
MELKHGAAELSPLNMTAARNHKPHFVIER